MTAHHIASPQPADALRRLASAELSLGSRVGHVALLLAALILTALIAALWATEPSLPPRTQIAFAVLILIGSAWVGFASWVLTRRRALFARDSVIAGRMAVTFCGVFLAGSLAVGFSTGQRAAYAAAGLGAVMVACAAWMLVRARQKFARLDDRRRALESEIKRLKEAV